MIASELLMAFDRFAMNVHLASGIAINAYVARSFGELLAPPTGPLATAKRLRDRLCTLRPSVDVGMPRAMLGHCPGKAY